MGQARRERQLSTDAKEAASQLLSGHPHAAARRWLGPTVLLALILFAADTVLVVRNEVLPYDGPVTAFVQSVNWGVVVYPMALINWLGGYNQIALGAVAIGALFIAERRAGWLMAVGAISSLLDNVIKLAIARHRPPVDLVHVVTPAPGYSYPSGHAVFFTWMSFMLVASIAPKIRPAFRVAAWTAAVLVIILTCLARVWAGAHWPSDVVGGVLLGLGWSAFVLWIPERWLPSPKRTWFQARPWQDLADRIGRVRFRYGLLVVAAACAIGFGILTAVVVAQPYIPLDATVERDVQATSWGPIALTFPFFSWIGDAKGAVLEAVVILAIIVVNRRAWLIAACAAPTGLWYVLISHLVLRPRPTTAYVLRVTEHPGASSFPSGHTIFVGTIMAVLMLCIGYRYLPRGARPAGWALVVVTVLACGISRINSGAHWPTDVVAGLLVAIGWLSLVMSVKPISDRAFPAEVGARTQAPRLEPAETQAYDRRAASPAQRRRSSG